MLNKAKDVSNEEKIRELYRWVYSRHPDADELKIALAHLKRHEKDPKVAWEDITWAEVKTKYPDAKVLISGQDFERPTSWPKYDDVSEVVEKFSVSN